MNFRTFISPFFGFVLALGMPVQPTLAGVSASFTSSGKGDVEILRVHGMAWTNPQYRKWLKKRAATDPDAAKALTLSGQLRRGQKLSQEEDSIVLRLQSDYRRDRAENYNSYLRRRAKNDPKARFVLEFETGGPRPSGYSHFEFEGLRRNFEIEFKRDRERETDFMVWVRNAAEANNEDAKIVVALEDGLTRAEGLGDDAEDRARKNLLDNYNKMKNQLIGEYAEARQALAVSFQELAAKVKKRNREGNRLGQGALVTTQEERDEIADALGRLERAQSAARREFGQTAWQNLLGASSTFVDDDGNPLIMQSRIQNYCGQCAVSLFGEAGNQDDLVAKMGAPETGTFGKDLIEYLASRKFEAASFRFFTAEHASLTEEDVLKARIAVIENILLTSDYPVIVGIQNEDDFLAQMKEMDEFNKNTLVPEESGAPSVGTAERVLGHALWTRLSDAYSNAQYRHWIVIQDIRQGQVAHVLDSDAGTYQTPLDKILNAPNFEIVYVKGKIVEDNLPSDDGPSNAAPVEEGLELEAPGPDE